MAIFVVKPKEQNSVVINNNTNDSTTHKHADQVNEQDLGEEATEEDMDNMKKLGANLKESKITVRGPLSKIFSEALNKVLAKESVMTTVASDMEESTLADTSNNGVQIYVYAAHQDDLDYKGAMIDAADSLKLALDSNKGNQIKTYLYMESSHRPSKKIDLMHSWCKSNNVEFIFKDKKNSQTIASEHIVNSLRGV